MMFSSLSSCVPNTNVSTEYRATYNHKLVVVDPLLTLYRNGLQVTSQPVLVKTGDTLQVRLTTPAGYLAHRFHSYYIDGIEQYFAVVNQNNYSPVLKEADVKRKWYNYINFTQEITFSTNALRNTQRLVGFGHGLIDVEELHVVLDPLTYSVSFYSVEQICISRVELPASPIEYRKSISDQQVGTYTHDLIVLGSDFKVYRIRFDRRYYASDEFKPKALPFFSLDDLPFQQDLPVGGSFLDLARKKFLNSLFPIVTALDVTSNQIWLAGAGAVYVLNRNFQLQNQIAVPGEEIVTLTCWQNGAVVTTKSQKAIFVNSATKTVLYTSTALGTPAKIDNDRVAVPESNAQRLLIFTDSTGSYTVWPTPGFVPAYCRNFENRLWVTGHDTIDVLEYKGDDTYGIHRFADKVTIVSVVGTSILASHYLKNYTVLNLTGIEKVIPFTMDSKLGPVSHIGSNPVEVKMLGDQNIMPKAPNNTTVYTNGIENEPVSVGDYVSVSYRSSAQGRAKTVFVLGENAFDFEVRSVSSAQLTDHYKSGNIADLRISGATTFTNTVPTGTHVNGMTTDIPLGFNFRLWDYVMANVNVSTNGYITFDSNISTDPAANLAAFAFPAVYAIHGNLYQGLPIDNRNPTNIIPGALTSGEQPGVYYQYQNFKQFDGLRVRWVGTSMDSYPFGNTLPVWTNTVSHNEIPVADLSKANVGDYVSGTGITNTTTVTYRDAYYQTPVIRTLEPGTNSLVTMAWYSSWFGIGRYLIKKYANVHIGGIFQGRISSEELNEFLGSNYDYRTLATLGNILVVDLHIDPTIDSTFQIGSHSLWQNGGVMSPGYAVLRSDIVSVNRFTETVTVIKHYSASKQTLVSVNDYDKLYSGQRLTGTGLPADARLIGKQVIVKTITASVDRSVATEGNNLTANTVTISVTTTNIANGYELEYSIAGATSDDFLTSPAMSGTVIVNSNAASLILRPNADAVVEGTETVSVTFGNISDIHTTSTTVQFNIIDEGNSVIAASSSTSSVTEYTLILSMTGSPTIASGTTYTAVRTEVEFSSDAANLMFGTYLYAIRQRVYLDRPLTATVIASSVFEGNFFGISNAVSLTENTPILFKKYQLHPAMTYEAGFYSGRGFQYIELFYDTLDYTSTKPVGVAVGNNTISANVVATAGMSYLFGSYGVGGDWIYMGAGCFHERSLGYLPRHPDVVMVPALTSTEARYEFSIDQTIPTQSNVVLGLNYGYLTVNGAPYSGFVGNITGNAALITPTSFVSVTVPFSRSQRSIAPILSLGDYQFALPAVPESQRINYVIVDILYENLPQDTVYTANVTIDASGTYYIPYYYTASFDDTGLIVSFTRTRSGNTISLTKGTFVDFIIGDVVTVENVITSLRLFDRREIVITGPKTYRMIFRTAPPGPWFANVSYATLENPYTRYLTYVPRKAGYLETELHYDGEPAYFTGNATLTAGPVAGGRLVVDNPGVNFNVNGRSYGEYVTNVTTGSNVELQWYVGNYYESAVTVYQLQSDVDGSNIRLPIATWQINNQIVSNQGILTGGDNNYELDVVDLERLEQQIVPTSSIEPGFIESRSETTFTLEKRYYNRDDLVEFEVSRQFEAGPVRAEIAAPIAEYKKGNIVKVGAPEQGFIGQGTQFLGNVKTAEFVEQVTQFNGAVTSPEQSVIPTMLYFDAPSEKFYPPAYFETGTVSSQSHVPTQMEFAAPSQKFQPPNYFETGVVSGQSHVPTQMEFSAPSQKFQPPNYFETGTVSGQSRGPTQVSYSAPTQGYQPATYFEAGAVSNKTFSATEIRYTAPTEGFQPPTYFEIDNISNGLAGPTLTYTAPVTGQSPAPKLQAITNEYAKLAGDIFIRFSKNTTTYSGSYNTHDNDDFDVVQSGTQNYLEPNARTLISTTPVLTDAESDVFDPETLFVTGTQGNWSQTNFGELITYNGAVGYSATFGMDGGQFRQQFMANIFYTQSNGAAELPMTLFNTGTTSDREPIQNLFYDSYTPNLTVAAQEFLLDYNGNVISYTEIVSNNYLGNLEQTANGFLIVSNVFLANLMPSLEIPIVGNTGGLENLIYVNTEAEYTSVHQTLVDPIMELAPWDPGIEFDIGFEFAPVASGIPMQSQYDFDPISENIRLSFDFAYAGMQDFYWRNPWEKIELIDSITLQSNFDKYLPGTVPGLEADAEIYRPSLIPGFESTAQITSMSAIPGFGMNAEITQFTQVSGFEQQWIFTGLPGGIDGVLVPEIIRTDRGPEGTLEPLFVDKSGSPELILGPDLVQDNIMEFGLDPLLYQVRYPDFKLTALRSYLDFNIRFSLPAINYSPDSIIGRNDPELDQEPLFVLDDSEYYGVRETRILEFIAKKDWDGHIANTVVCGQASLNNRLYLDVPNGFIVRKVDFASFGTPDGDCPVFVQHPTYHAANTAAIVETIVLNRTGNIEINVGYPYFTSLYPGTEERLAVTVTAVAETGSEPQFILFDQTYRASRGGFREFQSAVAQAGNYVSAMAYQIPGTNYYNSRIFFNTHIFAVPSRPKMYYYGPLAPNVAVTLPDFFERGRGTEKSYHEVIPADPGYRRTFYNHPSGFITSTGQPTNLVYHNSGPDKYVIARRMKWPVGWLIRGG
jgi:hypothetical protein